MKFRINYRDRAKIYCTWAGVVMPPNFDTTKSTERYIAVNMSASLPTLVLRSTFFPKELIAFLLKPENADTTFKVIDLKRGCKVFLNAERRLERGVSVVCKNE